MAFVAGAEDAVVAAAAGVDVAGVADVELVAPTIGLG